MRGSSPYPLRSSGSVTAAVHVLEDAGYRHRGNPGLPDRETFDAPDERPERHVYLCMAGTLHVRNHLAVRDILRMHPELAGTLDESRRVKHPIHVKQPVHGKRLNIGRGERDGDWNAHQVGTGEVWFRQGAGHGSRSAQRAAPWSRRRMAGRGHRRHRGESGAWLLGLRVLPHDARNPAGVRGNC
ncbi:GrpB family protein [Arthrobacter sunyaminii]|uniref:GrpB family protein n=1 Tax=Arthrobacter sunyaminii TaxID=2816859 RepID=A0A975S8S2_9MICC|nr:GrpB family protein [Arthrobacter sunyaminii]QWQ37935.1 GrpB family protein [Arthrobacter sunyaminii]